MDRTRACGARNVGSIPTEGTNIDGELAFAFSLHFQYLCYMSVIDNFLSFLRLTHEAHKVERTARIPGENRYATMVEHSWQLAMAAWYIIDTETLPLNKELVLKYALAHDLVETYAGDTFIYDTEAVSSKHERELAARDRIASEHPEFKELIQTIDVYEARQDEESKFLYALDKLIDPCNIYLEDGLLWREKAITLDMLSGHKEQKVRTSPLVYDLLYKDLWAKLKEREPELFGVIPSAQ